MHSGNATSLHAYYAPTTAFRLGEKTSDPLEMYASDICTVTVNIAGLRASAYPAGSARGSLPIGLQLIGRSSARQNCWALRKLTRLPGAALR